MNKGIKLLLSDKPIRKCSSGRKKGSGDRTARLEIRCKPELLEVLEELQRIGWTWAGKSSSDIIHAAVKHLAKIDLSDGTSDELYNKIWKLSDQ